MCGASAEISANKAPLFPSLVQIVAPLHPLWLAGRGGEGARGSRSDDAGSLEGWGSRFGLVFQHSAGRPPSSPATFPPRWWMVVLESKVRPLSNKCCFLHQIGERELVVWLLAGRGGEVELYRHDLTDEANSSLTGRGGEGGWNCWKLDPSLLWWSCGSLSRESLWVRQHRFFYGFHSSSRAGALRGRLGFTARGRRALAALRCCSMSGLLLLDVVVASGGIGFLWCNGDDRSWRCEANLFFCGSKSEALCHPIILARSRPSSSPASTGDSSTSVARPSCCRGGLEDEPDCFLLIFCRVLCAKRLGMIVILFLLGSNVNAALRLLKDSFRVTIVDNLSRGNIGAVKVLQNLFPEPGRLQFIYADLGDPKAINRIFAENAFDAVMHFAAVAYVGESTLEPLRYYHNITANTLVVLEAMATHSVKTLIYSSTCATYGEPEKMPITEETPQFPINPYGKAKKMAEDIILDFSKSRKSDMSVMILRYFNVIGSDPEGRLGEAPPPELREHGRISGACFDAALGIIPGLKVKGTDYETPDGTCVRDYIDVTDLVDAHVKALNKAERGKVGIYNVGTGRGRSVKEFVEACKKATGVDIKVDYFSRRPGDYAEVYSDPAKINRELNWTAQHTELQESLRVAWTWQMKHWSGYGQPQAMIL